MSRATDPDAKEGAGDATDPKASINSLISSYASAMSLAQTTTSTATIAEALAKHYLPNFTTFASGHVRSIPNLAAATTGVKDHLDRLVSSGVGCDVRFKSSKVDCVGVSSAICWIEWEIVPADGRQGWSWTNAYLYRKKIDGTEGWEGVICDQEVEGLVKNVPRIYE
jgi:hypothetical protein